MSRRHALLGAALLPWGCRPPRPPRRGARGSARVLLGLAPLHLRLRHTWTIARGSADTKLNGLLSLSADGVVGFGEVSPSPRYGQSFDSALAAFPRLRQAVADKNPWSHREWLEAAERAVPKEAALRAALDAALWDWKGKQLGQPVHRVLGTPTNRMPLTSFSIGMDEPSRMGEHAAQATGYAVLKVKLGLPGERAMLEAVQKACSCRVRVDANEGWSAAELEEKLSWLADREVELVEQPLRAGEEASLRPLLPSSRLPVVADESARQTSDLFGLVGAFHGVNVKLSKCGGITRALEMIATARALKLRVMLGCMIESSLGIAAALPLAPLVDWVDLDGNLLLADDPFGGLLLSRGRWQLPFRPGLGVAQRGPSTPRSG